MCPFSWVDRQTGIITSNANLATVMEPRRLLKEVKKGADLIGGRKVSEDKKGGLQIRGESGFGKEGKEGLSDNEKGENRRKSDRDRSMRE